MTIELALTKCGLDNGITNHSSHVVTPYSTYCSGSIYTPKQKSGEIKKIRRKEKERGERDYLNWQYSLVNFHTVFNVPFAYSISSTLNVATP